MENVKTFCRRNVSSKLGHLRRSAQLQRHNLKQRIETKAKHRGGYSRTFPTSQHAATCPS